MTNKTVSIDKFPVFRTVFGSFGLFLDNMKSYLLIGSVFSLIITVLNYLSGQSLMCGNALFNEHIFCSRNLYVFMTSNVLLWFVFCVYARIWSQSAILKKYAFSLKTLLPNKTDLKLYAFALLFTLSIFIALGAGFLLYKRVPNPDWKIELIYFSIVSIGFFAPMFATPLLSYATFAIEDEKLPSIKELWQASRQRIVLIFISFVSVMLISFLASSSVLRYFLQLSMVDNIFVVVIAEFLYNIVIMFIVSVYMNYCYMQKKILFERD